MIIAIGCDHGGYQRKEEAKEHLKAKFGDPRRM